MFDPGLVFIDCTNTAMMRLRATVLRGKRLVGLRAAWPLENNHLCGRPAAMRRDRTVCARRSDERAGLRSGRVKR